MKSTSRLTQKFSCSLLFLGLAIVNTHCKNDAKLSGGVPTKKVEAPKEEVKEPPVVVAKPPVIPKVEPIPAPEPLPTIPPEVVGAVQKGSFTVWTMPKDPKPWQDYSIFVQIALPSNVTDYKLNDLNGRLVGTDFYTQSFGGVKKPKSFKVIPGAATVEINVPGSYISVKDKITVKSELLDEEQEIFIVF